MLAATKFQQWSLLPLRLIVGYGFIAHGYAKVSRGPDTFAAVLQAIGVPQAHVMAWLTIIIELAGGAAVLLGASRTVPQNDSGLSKSALNTRPALTTITVSRR